jgi:hypothetical protein
VEEVAFAAFDDAGDGQAIVEFALAVVGDAAGFEFQEILGGDEAAEEVGVFLVAEGLRDGPGLDAAFVVAFDVFEACTGRSGSNLVEEGVGVGDVFLIGVGGFGDVAEDVVLGKEAAAVDVIAEENDFGGGRGS